MLKAPVRATLKLDMHALERLGRPIFALMIAALGVENVVVARSGAIVTPVLPWLPAHHPFWAVCVGVALLALATGILIDSWAWTAATSLGIGLTAYALVRQVSGLIEHPLDVSVRTGVFEVLALAGAALALATTLPRPTRALDKVIGAGRFLFAVSMVVFGIDHFIVLDLIISLVPSWIPGGGWFWAVLTGAGMIAAGLSFATRVQVRLLGLLLAAMFGLWFLLLHAPRVAQPPRSYNPDEWSSAFIALAMCGSSLIMVRALRR